MCGQPLHCKCFFDDNHPRSGAVMCPACWCGYLTAGPDEFRGLGSNQRNALITHDNARSFPIPGSTGMLHIKSFSPLQIIQLFLSALNLLLRQVRGSFLSLLTPPRRSAPSCWPWPLSPAVRVGVRVDYSPSLPREQSWPVHSAT